MFSINLIIILKKTIIVDLKDAITYLYKTYLF